MYSQGSEEQAILQYFGNMTGTCLSIGENDGTTYSNVFQLIKDGWKALLVEPSDKVFPELVTLHDGNENVAIVKAAIGGKDGKSLFYDSGGYLLKGTSSLLSTTIPDERIRWGSEVIWEEYEVPVITFETLLKNSPYKKFDFISLDAEGQDLEILRQMNLYKLNCKVICIEHNSIPEVLEEIISYCKSFGLEKELLRNAENIILAV
jgi:FkbM family methyltransferase